jgi:hypothetical protein
VISGADAGNYTLVDSSFQTLGAIGGDPLNGEAGTLARQPTLPGPVVPVSTTVPPAGVDVTLPSDFGGGTVTVGYGTGSTGGTGSGGTNGANAAGGTDGTGGTSGANGANSSRGGGGAANIGLQGSGGTTSFETPETNDVSGKGLGGDTNAAGGGSGAGAGARTNTAASVDGSSGSGSAMGSANANARDYVTVSQVRSATAEDNGQVTVSVPEEVVSSGETFSFVLPSNVTDGATKAKVRVTLVNENRLPKWLKYISATRTFVATAMPGGALPLDVLATLGSMRTVVSIVERKAQ